MTARAYTDLVSMFEGSVARFGERPFLGVRSAGGTWTWHTYREVQLRIDALRAGLARRGVTRGTTVAIISNNRLEWVVGCHATYGLAASWAPMYESQHEDDWRYILQDCRASVIFVSTPDVAKKIAKLRADLPDLRHVISLTGTSDADESFSALCAEGAQHPVSVTRPEGGDIANLIYTSGTTGAPKGVRLSHKSVISALNGLAEVIPVADDDRSFAFLPWAHVAGGSVEVHGITYVGASLAICEAVDQVLPGLMEVKPTLLVAVPRIWNRIYDVVQKGVATKPAFLQWVFRKGLEAGIRSRKGEALSSGERILLAVARKVIFKKIKDKFGGRLKYAISGAAALSKDVGEFIDALGITVYEGYGMTECCGLAAANHPGAQRIGSVGRPLPGVTITLDKDAPGASEGEGEIIISGACVMDGYQNQPEETAKVLSREGLRSGDLGRIDADGFVFITGRVKELYKLENGKYVAPAPLEEGLTLSPLIQQVLVYGDNRRHNVALVVPDGPALAERMGLPVQTPLSELVTRPEARPVIQEEVSRYSNAFRGYERIEKFALLGEPFTTDNGLLTPTLKIKRRVAVDRYKTQLDALYAQEN